MRTDASSMKDQLLTDTGGAGAEAVLAQLMEPGLSQDQQEQLVAKLSGQVQSETVPHGADAVGVHEKPLVYLHQAVHGLDSPGVVNEQAVFNFQCIRAIYDCAAAGRAQVVSKEDL